MAAETTAQRIVLPALFALAACGTGEVRESVFSIESFCSIAPRIAIVVEVIAPSDVKIASVTATHTSEQRCYLERAAADSADDAGEPGGALYSCLAQGSGTYTVRVKSAKRTWTQDVEVSGDECHVAKLQQLSFDLD